MPTVNDFFSGLSAAQKSNMVLIIQELRLQGITNQYTIAAILSIVSKECQFNIKIEKDYSQTSVTRIREVFKKSTAKLSDAEINALKSDPVKWFNFLYGGRNGNRPGTNDGYFYRGRYFNQVTFRDLYKKLSEQLKLPELLTNPDKYLTDPKVCADILIQYYKNAFDRAKTVDIWIDDTKQATKKFASEYGTNDINGFTDLAIAVRAAFHCNAGLGRSLAYIKADQTKGLKLAMGRSSRFLQIVQQTK